MLSWSKHRAVHEENCVELHDSDMSTEEEQPGEHLWLSIHRVLNKYLIDWSVGENLIQ